MADASHCAVCGKELDRFPLARIRGDEFVWVHRFCRGAYDREVREEDAIKPLHMDQ